MSGIHARVAPSELDRTVACNAWIQLSDGLPPEPDTEETLEGNAADWVAKQYAAGVEVPHGAPTPVPGIMVDYDMIHGARMWADTIGYGAVSGVPVVIERIHPTDCWGEPDGWRWDAIEGVLRMPDYKYGFGIVEVFENWQLIAYAAGIMDTLNLKDSDVLIEFIIVQPRAHHPGGPVRKWRVRGDNIRVLVNMAFNAAMVAWPPDYARGITAPPEAKTGPHCLHCPARGRCGTLQAAVSDVAEYAGKAEAVALPPDAVGVELLILEHAKELLEGRITALQAQAEAMLRSGHRIPNYQLESTQSRLMWNDGVTADEILGLPALLQKQVDLHRPAALPNSRNSTVVTPTQAIKAGIDATVIGNYASRSTSAMKLARISTTEARRAFGATTL